MGVMEEIRRHVRVIKEKLSAAAIPADALETAHHFLETVVKDVTFAAHGLTKDALNRIKTRLVDILPSLFPAITRKVIDVSYSPPSSSHNSSRCTMVDDAAKEVNGEKECEEKEEEEERGNHSSKTSPNKAPYVSPTSTLFASPKPFSRL